MQKAPQTLLMSLPLHDLLVYAIDVNVPIYTHVITHVIAIFTLSPRDVVCAMFMWFPETHNAASHSNKNLSFLTSGSH